MSRRVQLEEQSDSGDEFDDDTDLPLPSTSRSALPNTGTKGAILEEITIEQEPTAPPEAPRRAPAPSSSRPMPSGASTSGTGSGTSGGMLDPSHPLYKQFAAANRAAGGGRSPQTVDMSNPAAMAKYKKWTCIYPIYIDAKRAYAVGGRRIAREKSVWWPKSDDITTAAASLQLNVLHEADKAHPRDWENPGRVKVQWKQDDGRLTNPSIPTKKKLLEAIAAYIQRNKPSLVPDMAALSINDDEVEASQPPPSKAPAIKKGVPGKGPAKTSKKSRQPRLPRPPQPIPSLQDRYTWLSPAIPTGALLEGWKVGGGADKAPGEAGTATPGPGHGGAGKGKRKIIRIRQ